MKKGILFSLAVLSTLPLHAAEPASMDRTNVADLQMNIKGEFKGYLPVKKLDAPVTLNLDTLENFPEDPTQKFLLEPLPRMAGRELNHSLEMKGHARFWPSISPLPVPPFVMASHDGKSDVKKWEFQVIDAAGKVICRKSGESRVPSSIDWDGQDEQKKMAMIDHLYTSHLLITQKDGNTITVPGQAVMLPAMGYGGDASRTVEFSLARLFKPGRAEISKEGEILMMQAEEYLNKDGFRRFHIRVSQKAKSLGAKREAVLVEQLAKDLHLRPDQLTHDHQDKPGSRGEIAVIWAKKELTK